MLSAITCMFHSLVLHNGISLSMPSVLHHLEDVPMGCL